MSKITDSIAAKVVAGHQGVETPQAVIDGTWQPAPEKQAGKQYTQAEADHIADKAVREARLLQTVQRTQAAKQAPTARSRARSPAAGARGIVRPSIPSGRDGGPRSRGPAVRLCARHPR